jgi:hypothetical protein
MPRILHIQLGISLSNTQHIFLDNILSQYTILTSNFGCVCVCNFILARPYHLHHRNQNRIFVLFVIIVSYIISLQKKRPKSNTIQS